MHFSQNLVAQFYHLLVRRHIPSCVCSRVDDSAQCFGSLFLSGQFLFDFGHLSFPLALLARFRLLL
jgi:hypothetical protein